MTNPPREKKGIVAFAFGMPFSIPANEAIHDVACGAAHIMNAPVFTQLDCGIMNPHVPNGVWILPQIPDTNPPPPTLRIARFAAAKAKELGLTELHVVAAPPHIWRCMRDMRMAMKETCLDATLSACGQDIFLEEHSPSYWFYAKGEQYCTRYRWWWTIRDAILFFTPLWLYKRIVR